MFNIVLYQPEIPQNTGNIARTCVVTGAHLHLIKPYGFVINDRTIKRAGLDYWEYLNIHEYDDFDDFLKKNHDACIYPVTTQANRFYTEMTYSNDDYFLFGRETSGLPSFIHKTYKENRIRIPMQNEEYARCLNLSNSVAIILYEALRQVNFSNMI